MRSATPLCAWRRSTAAPLAPLTAAQYHALTALTLVPGQSVGQLANRLLCDKANASGLVERLARQGLVERARDPDDKRRVVLSLTPSGRAAVAAGTQVRAETLRRVLSPLDQEGLDATTVHVSRLAELLGRAVGAWTSRPAVIDSTLLTTTRSTREAVDRGGAV